MPRVRCHWALLVRTREATATTFPRIHADILAENEAFFAGGVAPDAIRLFDSFDKRSSHFYDDQDPATWSTSSVVDTCISERIPNLWGVHASRRSRVWMYGYLAHIMADVANWRHILKHLPPFPAERGAHHGVWLLADRLTVPEPDRWLNLEKVPYDDAPPWVLMDPVSRLLKTLVMHVLPQTDPWIAEAAYVRHNADLRQAEPLNLLASGIDSSVLAIRDRYRVEWEDNVKIAKLLVPASAWSEFEQSAIEGSIEAIRLLDNRIGI
ncbi:MAG: hypothetical protein EXR45_05665 [Chloroflexi bacterium]|nr:hypothetical protein [Chloroflexota bacterium]